MICTTMLFSIIRKWDFALVLRFSFTFGFHFLDLDLSLSLSLSLSGFRFGLLSILAPTELKDLSIEVVCKFARFYLQKLP